MSVKLQCPVCGKDKSPLAVSDYDCDNCGFNNAFVRYFATEKVHKLWLQSIDKAKLERKAKFKIQLVSSIDFWIGNNSVVFADKQKKSISIILGNGRTQNERNATAFSSSERNYAVLYENGSIAVFGEDNSYGQKNTESWREIQFVLAAPNCTYGVTKKGGVVYAGSLCSTEVLKWNNVKLLRTSGSSIVGLSSNGKVLVTNDFGSSEIVDDMRKWDGVADIVTSRDSALGLTANGSVKFAGKPDDPRKQVESWKNITSIAIDNSFAYGLSNEGGILVAGTCKAFLDRGRSKVSQWNHILCLSSNQGGVGAISENGELYFAGTITGDLSKMKDAWNAELSRYPYFKETAYNEDRKAVAGDQS